MAEQNLQTNLTEDTVAVAEAVQQNQKESKNNSKEKVDLHSLSSENAEKCYVYAIRLVEKGYNTLASEVVKQSLENAYSSSCVASAISREGFSTYLEKGYYSTCKLYELFNMIAAMGIKQDKHDEIADSILRMHKMYAASIRTIQKKTIAPQNGHGF
ncbi:MAG: hypothetical protein MJ153_03155 [Clostridia bacterium]|nr:hypothetical protein [Clostridia bacterium]